MELLNMSKKDKEVVVTLDADELVRLCNVLYAQKEYDDNLQHKLYGELMMARDLCQYGHIDGFCFEKLAECRSKIK